MRALTYYRLVVTAFVALLVPLGWIALSDGSFKINHAWPFFLVIGAFIAWLSREFDLGRWRW